jgi:hypothetical protein
MFNATASARNVFRVTSRSPRSIADRFGRGRPAALAKDAWVMPRNNLHAKTVSENGNDDIGRRMYHFYYIISTDPPWRLIDTSHRVLSAGPPSAFPMTAEPGVDYAGEIGMR